MNDIAYWSADDVATFQPIFMALVQIVWGHGRIQRGGIDRTEQLSRAARKALPAVAVVSVLMMMWLFF
jgi:hypothetical protein